MTAAVYIYREPTGIVEVLARVLVGLTIRVQPALLELTNDPAIGTNTNGIFLDNADIRKAISASSIGPERAEGFYLLLPLGRATWIPCDCCIETEYRFAVSSN
jgi:hypothetical protein